MYKVMIVDDMEIFRRVFRQLKVWNNVFTIVGEAKDGMEALEKLETNKVDLVFIDIKMPRMDGIELLRNISEKKLCPCVVLLSDYTEYNYAREGFIYGAFDYIGKSISEAELKQLLEKIKLYLDQKYILDQKLAKLQELIDETYLISIDVKFIAQRICHGEARISILIDEMIDSINVRYGYENGKGLIILKNTILEIINEILKCYSWLPLYINLTLLYNINILNCTDLCKIRKAIHGLVEALLSVINRFMPCHNNVIIKNTCEYILSNVHEVLSVGMISEQMYISKAHLSEIFKQRVGITLLAYITMTKMERAKILLAEEDKQNYEIAFQLGFRDYGYFNKVFKKYTGMSFAIYRKQQIGEK